MSRFFAGVLTALVAVVMTLGAVQDAEAKRLGGGKSFGSHPGYSQPYQRSTPPSAARAGGHNHRRDRLPEEGSPRTQYTGREHETRFR